MVDALEVGGVVIGDVPSFRVDNMPYGGVKESGVGREGGVRVELRAAGDRRGLWADDGREKFVRDFVAA